MEHLETTINEREKVVTIDGELLSDTLTSRTKHTITKRVTPDAFVQVYLKDLANVYEIKSRCQVNLLLVLCTEAKFPDGEGQELSTFTALKDDKDRWADKLKIKRGNTIDNALLGLRKRNVVVQVARSKYAINPEYVHYGALKTRDSLVELIIKYKVK